MPRLILKEITYVNTVSYELRYIGFSMGFFAQLKFIHWSDDFHLVYQPQFGTNHTLATIAVLAPRRAAAKH